MVRLAIGYLGLSFLAPIVCLLAFTGGDLLVTSLMTLPLAVTTFAYLWLVTEVARRDSLLERKPFMKAALICGVASLLLVAAVTDLVVTYAPQINLGTPLADFRMFYFVYTMALPTLAYSALVGICFWYVAIRNNSYITPYEVRTGISRWFTLPRAKRPAAASAPEAQQKAA